MGQSRRDSQAEKQDRREPQEKRERILRIEKRVNIAIFCVSYYPHTHVDYCKQEAT